jgi:hypothetical protein
MLYGNIASLSVSAVVCTVLSLRTPQNYDWDTMQVIRFEYYGSSSPKHFAAIIVKPADIHYRAAAAILQAIHESHTCPRLFN